MRKYALKKAMEVMDMNQKIDVMYNATSSEIKTIMCEGFKLNSKEIKRFLIEIEDMCLKFHKRSKDTV